MKLRLWVVQFLIVSTFIVSLGVLELGQRGHIRSRFLIQQIYPVLQKISAVFTDIKFRARGPLPPHYPIVIVEIDHDALERLGRWPWPRDLVAFLIESIYQAGAKVVGLDIVFPEPTAALPDAIAEVLRRQKLESLIRQFDPDIALTKVFSKHSRRLVTAWQTEGFCIPLYDNAEECGYADAKQLAQIPETFRRLAMKMVIEKPFEKTKTPIFSTGNVINNIPMLDAVTEYTGLVNAPADADGTLRRESLLVMVDGRPYPSLALEMARAALGEELTASFRSDNLLKSLNFTKSNRKIQTSPNGIVEINFAGKERTFPYLSARDVLEGEPGRDLASSKLSILKDAFVFIGVTALAVGDNHPTPFDYHVPGTEIHATVLDNILSDRFLRTGASGDGMEPWTMFLLLIFVGGVFSYGAQRMVAYQTFLLFFVFLGGMAALDGKLLFSQHRNWNTGFYYLELTVLFIFTVAAKYASEQKDRKFLRTAFSKYVAPAVVDSIVKDPKSLTLGGKRENLTLLFCDVRNFTTFSESVDAKVLAEFLNEHMDNLTALIFQTQGTLDKYIGDAIMAFWGAPLPQKNHARAACTSALKMLKNVQMNRQRMKNVYGIDLSVGIGINTGIVSVGNMGTTNNFSYTAIGDTVNLASRLEGATKNYGVAVLVSRSTLEDIGATGDTVPAHRYLDFLKVKGKHQAVDVAQIFDDDVPKSALEIFAEGRDAYRVRDWDQALRCFEESDRILFPYLGDHDVPSQLFIKRTIDFMVKDPPPDWTGEWELRSK